MARQGVKLYLRLYLLTAKWLEKTFLFSSHVFPPLLLSYKKGWFLYWFRYRIDKKGHRKEKNIRKKIGGLKECRNFAGEKKGTFKLAKSVIDE